MCRANGGISLAESSHVHYLQDIPRHARDAFDKFFERFPYCYGYWRKYAEFERKHENLERANTVYERGLAAIPLSVDLWLAYLAFYKEYAKNSDQEENQIRLWVVRLVKPSKFAANSSRR